MTATKTKRSVAHARTHRHLLALAIAATLGATAAPAWADLETTGQLKGRITNSGGKAIAGATITVRNEAQGFERSVVADADGEYVLKALPAGKYSLTITKPGFEPMRQTSLDVRVGGAASVDSTLKSTDGVVETVEIIGTRISRIDQESSSTSLVVTADDLLRFPIAPDATSIALKTPGVNQGDEDMGYLPSFGGASQSENAFFFNGLNITSIRSPLGYVGIPMEAVKETAVEAGGISAKYGRFSGGAINQISRSGGNEFQFAASSRYEPDYLGETQPSMIGPADDGSLTYHLNNEQDLQEWRELNFSASGPLIENKAFFYVLYSPTIATSQAVSGGGISDNGSLNRFRTESETVFANFDWYISEDHSLGFTYLNRTADRERKRFRYGPFVGIVSLRGFPTTLESETEMKTLNYNGQLTDNLSVSARYGEIYGDSISGGGTPNRNPVWITDTDGRVNPVGSWAGERVSFNSDSRDMLRVDFEWELGDHTLGWGYDQDATNSKTKGDYYGPNASDNYYYALRRSPAPTSFTVDNGVKISLPANTWYGRRSINRSNGSVDAEGSGYYIEDVWRVLDDVTLKIGMRNDSFSMDNAAGQELYTLDDQWAPRLGVVWNVFGDGNHKAYANFARYYVPMPPGMSMNLGVPGFAKSEYFLWDGKSYDAKELPVPGQMLGTLTTNTGKIPSPREQIADNLEPMFNEEFLIGYEFNVSPILTIGSRLVLRELGELIEDASLQHAVLNYCKEKKMACPGAEDLDAWDAASFRTINPGKDVQTWFDLNGDGQLEAVHLSNKHIGLPSAKRDYRGLEFYFNGKVNADLSLNGSYVNSRLYGNTDGFTRSDGDEDAAGQTTAFNFPGMMEYATGLLPNDHTHTIKLWGDYRFNDAWAFSFSYLGQSGRPMNAFGYHPDNVGSCAPGGVSVINGCNEQYDVTTFYHLGKPSPRGSGGRTNWVNNVDLGLNYRTALLGGELYLGLNIYNVFNFDASTQKEEWVEQGTAQEPERKLYAGMPNSWQAPRYVSFSARYEF